MWISMLPKVDVIIQLFILLVRHGVLHGFEQHVANGTNDQFMTNRVIWMMLFSARGSFQL